LWRSDGTRAGTVLVRDIYPGMTGSHPYDLTNVNGKLYFSASDVGNYMYSPQTNNGPYGRELWALGYNFPYLPFVYK
jgi:hypothetical protein